MTNLPAKVRSENYKPYSMVDFWKNAFAIQASVTPRILPNVLLVGVISGVISILARFVESQFGVKIGLQIAPYELIGAALAVLLVLRTNAGYDRWWEARKIWGGIVNQSRNLAIAGLAYGPDDKSWRDEFIKWVAVYPHTVRLSLRGEKPSPEVEALLGKEIAESLGNVDHMPGVVSMRISRMLREAYENGGMEKFAFLQADREKALLIDHVGACERIMNTPLALAYCIMIRRFIALFVLTLPLALLHQLGSDFLVLVLTMFVAYPLLSLDELGLELQNPFSKANLSHLPLDEISTTIERNVLALKDESNLGV